MIRLVLTLLLLALPAGAQVWPNPGPGRATTAGGAACTEDYTDDFSSDPGLDGAWDKALLHEANCTWTWQDSDALSWYVTATQSCSNNKNRSAHFDTALHAEQYACAKYVGRVDTHTVAPRLVLRADTSTSTSDFHFIAFAVGSTTVSVGAADFGADLDTCTLSSESLDAGDEMCAQITGSDGTTQFNMWVNPGAGTPDDWTANGHCCVNSTGANGCETSAESFTEPNLNNGGTYAGVGVRNTVGKEADDFMEFDDWVAGTCE